MSNFRAHIVAAFHRATQSPAQPNSLHNLRAA